MSKTMVTTFDNPYSPFDEYMDWNNYDNVHGYHTPERVDRIYQMLKDTMSKRELELTEDDEIYSEAQRRLVEADPLNLFRIVTAESIDDKSEEVDELKQAIKDREVDRNKYANEMKKQRIDS